MENLRLMLRNRNKLSASTKNNFHIQWNVHNGILFCFFVVQCLLFQPVWADPHVPPPTAHVELFSFDRGTLKVITDKVNVPVTLTQNLRYFEAYMFQCNGTYPVQWTYVGEGNPITTADAGRSFKDFYDISSYQYQSILLIYKLDELQSGRYICRGMLKDNEKLSIYYDLFVPVEGKSVLLSSADKTVYVPETKESAYIPCGVSDSTADISLYKGNQEGVFKRMRTNSSIHFHPRKGFRLNLKSLSEPYGKYMCTANANSRRRKVNLYPQGFKLYNEPYDPLFGKVPVQFSYEYRHNRVLCCSGTDYVPKLQWAGCTSIIDCQIKSVCFDEDRCEPRDGGTGLNPRKWADPGPLPEGCAGWKLRDDPNGDMGMFKCSTPGITQYQPYLLNRGNIFLDFEKAPPAEAIMSLQKLTKGPVYVGRQVEFHCNGTRFYFGYGVRWAFQRGNGDIEFIENGDVIRDRFFVTAHRRQSVLTIPHADITAIVCFGPIVNHPTEWRTVSLPLHIQEEPIFVPMKKPVANIIHDHNPQEEIVEHREEEKEPPRNYYDYIPYHDSSVTLQKDQDKPSEEIKEEILYDPENIEYSRPPESINAQILVDNLKNFRHEVSHGEEILNKEPELPEDTIIDFDTINYNKDLIKSSQTKNYFSKNRQYKGQSEIPKVEQYHRESGEVLNVNDYDKYRSNVYHTVQHSPPEDIYNENHKTNSYGKHRPDIFSNIANSPAPEDIYKEDQHSNSYGKHRPEISSDIFSRTPHSPPPEDIYKEDTVSYGQNRPDISTDIFSGIPHITTDDIYTKDPQDLYEKHRPTELYRDEHVVLSGDIFKDLPNSYDDHYTKIEADQVTPQQKDVQSLNGDLYTNSYGIPSLGTYNTESDPVLDYNKNKNNNNKDHKKEPGFPTNDPYLSLGTVRSSSPVDSYSSSFKIDSSYPINNEPFVVKSQPNEKSHSYTDHRPYSNSNDGSYKSSHSEVQTVPFIYTGNNNFLLGDPHARDHSNSVVVDPYKRFPGNTSTVPYNNYNTKDITVNSQLNVYKRDPTPSTQAEYPIKSHAESGSTLLHQNDIPNSPFDHYTNSNPVDYKDANSFKSDFRVPPVNIYSPSPSPSSHYTKGVTPAIPVKIHPSHELNLPSASNKGFNSLTHKGFNSATNQGFTPITTSNSKPHYNTIERPAPTHPTFTSNNHRYKGEESSVSNVNNNNEVKSTLKEHFPTYSNQIYQSIANHASHAPKPNNPWENENHRLTPTNTPAVQNPQNSNSGASVTNVVSPNNKPAMDTPRLFYSTLIKSPKSPIIGTIGEAPVFGLSTTVSPGSSVEYTGVNPITPNHSSQQRAKNGRLLPNIRSSYRELHRRHQQRLDAHRRATKFYKL